MTRRNCADQSINPAADHLLAGGADPQAVALENERSKLVQTVLDIRARREQAEDPGSRQQAERLLSAAVEDLERHDAVLDPDLGNAV